ncbi:uncharacterized protein I303_105631 [Kwoniella dejecticola CBS 10117]|uniref:2-oxoadipate dioxygenase/decarboxylase n=1 Tax=Kwoniella dejecticola CBS 10117 TaxID=1296121 RepID=A0A1A6A204_9TREE|nr:uncharacterized protein I303_04925 [Kwoniella dejecticola CBS 10117]OBR84069.1 hypothetical protein I303_04925 [Kwoniella dejecticola CBS 10117]
MIAQPFASPDDIRATFCTALSNMYKQEVPLYGDLIELVNDVNAEIKKIKPDLWEIGDRLNVERHGAIRLGTPAELSMISRLFRQMGMYPVGYYDLSTSGVPVHSTAFRPKTTSSLDKNPFRIFTSLLRLELIPDLQLRAEAAEILSQRDIFHPVVRELVSKAEDQGGLNAEDAQELVQHSLETFKWHDRALVSEDVYDQLKKTHPLLADIVGFKGPHINHLTPRTLDIDAVQRMMAERGIPPKKVIEGPPVRECPILLRQTSFQALTEPILFAGASPGETSQGLHRARFGEIESRGAALTREGHALYQSLMKQAGSFTPTDNNDIWQSKLSRTFSPFPDTWDSIRRANLAYFRYSLSSAFEGTIQSGCSLDQLIKEGKVTFTPIVYEDFLPASAAGIFQSNLGEHSKLTTEGLNAREEMELSLGRKIQDYFDLYEEIQRNSLREVQRLTGCRL